MAACMVVAVQGDSIVARHVKPGETALSAGNRSGRRPRSTIARAVFRKRIGFIGFGRLAAQDQEFLWVIAIRFLCQSHHKGKNSNLWQMPHGIQAVLVVY